MMLFLSGPALQKEETYQNYQEEKKVIKTSTSESNGLQA
jgi:hypothetical protein